MTGPDFFSGPEPVFFWGGDVDMTRPAKKKLVYIGEYMYVSNIYLRYM